MGRKKIGFAARLTAALAVLAAVSCLLAWGAERIRVQREYESRQAEILRQARDAERREKERTLQRAAKDALAREAAQNPLEGRTENEMPDWDALRQKNPDIYAWISIPEIGLEYPVLQNERDDYYLNHNSDGAEDASGSIYSNSCNRKDFSDFNTILYGHNMKDGSMFGSLSSIGQNQHEESAIYIYIEEKKLKYIVYAVVEFSDVYLPDMYGIRSSRGLESFLHAVENSPAFYQSKEAKAVEADRILTLSTCTGRDGSRRCLVVAGLAQEYSTEALAAVQP